MGEVCPWLLGMSITLNLKALTSAMVADVIDTTFDSQGYEVGGGVTSCLKLSNSFLFFLEVQCQHSKRKKQNCCGLFYNCII